MPHTIRPLFAAALGLACSLAAAQTYPTKLVRIVVPCAVGGAEMTFEGIATSRFYVFPHPQIRKDIQTRMEDILELRNPTRTV